ncbi:MAG: hypothetical protein ACJ739_10570 [Acidimicrobiales bacterium]
MVALAAHGVSVDLPRGWDGQIRTVERPEPSAAGPAAAPGTAGAPAPVILHAGSFPLPAERGDYGSGAVEVMQGSDVLVCLLEHEPEAATTALFRRHGLPRLRADRFSPQTMQRAVPGMAGTQHFFQVAGRPFCLYVVVGSYTTRGPLVRAADDVVRTIRLDA